MPNMELITSVTVGAGGAASVRVPGTGSIPSTYTDLKLIISGRSSKSDITDYALMTFNGTSSNYSTKLLWGSGANTGSFNWSLSNTFSLGVINAASNTASTFSSSEVYIPNYTSTGTKSISTDTVQEGNTGTNIYAMLSGGLDSTTGSALTYITLTCEGGSWVEGSTFYLYGISNVTSSPKATGGIVSQDNSYWYHMFPFTSTFTPTSNITCDYLVIAGGGGGAQADYTGGGGGGAGGLRSTVTATGGGGTIESAVALTSGTAYTITVGAGGATANSGSNSSIAGSGLTTITSVGGGRGGAPNYAPLYYLPATGGSGGGAGAQEPSNKQYAAAGTANQGYAGGESYVSSSTAEQQQGGGGGGAGGVGVNATSSDAGAGGPGVQITALANPTFTGVSNGYYAGGGGGGKRRSGVAGVGGIGGGGSGRANSTSAAFAGITNTGGGGGGAGIDADVVIAGGNGGSGLVILRYAK